MNTMIQQLREEIADLIELNEEFGQGYAQTTSAPRNGMGLHVHQGFWSACAFDAQQTLYTPEFTSAEEALAALAGDDLHELASK